jgi:hypothetical protein
MSKKMNGSRRKRTRTQESSSVGVPRLAMGTNLVFGFPDKMLTKLRYVDTYLLSISSGSIAKQVMYVNSVFDPDNSGTGHQPLYRDTYAGIYDQYAVVSAKCKVKFMNLSSGDSLICGMVIDDDASTSTTANTLCEQNHGQHTILPPISGSLSSHTFTFDWDCKKILGIDPFASETYKTPVASNPTEISSLLLWVTNTNATSFIVPVHFEMEQTILWTELTSPVQS